MVNLTVYLISESYYSYERREYAFMIFWKYIIIFRLPNRASVFRKVMLAFESFSNYLISEVFFYQAWAGP